MIGKDPILPHIPSDLGVEPESQAGSGKTGIKRNADELDDANNTEQQDTRLLEQQNDALIAKNSGANVRKKLKLALPGLDIPKSGTSANTPEILSATPASIAQSSNKPNKPDFPRLTLPQNDDTAPTLLANPVPQKNRPRLRFAGLHSSRQAEVSVPVNQPSNISASFKLDEQKHASEIGDSKAVQEENTKFKDARYPNNSFNALTAVGETHANRITINDKSIGIASQVPTIKELPEFLTTLFNNASSLVVLASDNDFLSEEFRMPQTVLPYFRDQNEKEYGDYKISSTCMSDEPEKIGEFEGKRYQLSITFNGETRKISVLNITNWPDKTLPEHADTLNEMVSKAAELDIDSAGEHAGKEQVTHCLAGQNRTGLFMAAKAGKENPGLPFKEVVGKMQEDRPGMLEHEKEASLALLEKLREK